MGGACGAGTYWRGEWRGVAGSGGVPEARGAASEDRGAVTVGCCDAGADAEWAGRPVWRRLKEKKEDDMNTLRRVSRP